MIYRDYSWPERSSILNGIVFDAEASGRISEEAADSLCKKIWLHGRGFLASKELDNAFELAGLHIG